MSYESLTLADLKDLATTIHIKGYGTKDDTIGRIKAHPVGTSLLNKLETSKKKEKEKEKEKEDDETGDNVAPTDLGHTVHFKLTIIGHESGGLSSHPPTRPVGSAP